MLFSAAPHRTDITHYATRLPAGPLSARAARQFVQAGLAAKGLRSDDAELVTSELVTNVARHVGADFVLELKINGCVRIEVADASRAIPAVADVDVEAERGRGLFIVAALARAWGVAATARGKRIWVELEAEPLPG